MASCSKLLIQRQSSLVAGHTAHLHLPAEHQLHEGRDLAFRGHCLISEQSNACSILNRCSLSSTAPPRFQAFKGTKQINVFSQALKNYLNLRIDTKHLGQSPMKMCSGVNSTVRACGFYRYRNGLLWEKDVNAGLIRASGRIRSQGTLVTKLPPWQFRV